MSKVVSLETLKKILLQMTDKNYCKFRDPYRDPSFLLFCFILGLFTGFCIFIACLLIVGMN